MKSAFENLTTAIVETISAEGSFGYNAVSNTSSFSVVLFSTDKGSSDDEPILYQYHHDGVSKSNASTTKIDADSVYRIADISMAFTSWLFLINAGNKHWSDPVADYIPELSELAGSNPVDTAQWADITLGDLAGHMAGIGRDYGFMDLALTHPSAMSGAINESGSKPPCGLSMPCNKTDFLDGFLKHAPVQLSSTGPIYSHAAYQLFGYALSNMSQGASYASMLSTSILKPLNMNSTCLSPPLDTSRNVVPGNESASAFSQALGDLSPALGLYSTPRDLAAAGRAMLQSSLMPATETRRWLQPHAFTSNLVNTVGRPWEIYAGTSSLIEPIVPVFTKQGWLGAYSSYLGLVPDYGVGFAILAADAAGAPDPNALADVIGAVILPAVVKAAAQEAAMGLAGRYSSGNATDGLTVTQDNLPGLSISNLTSGGVDVRAAIARISDIAPEQLDMRLWPTNLRSSSGSSQRVSWRAVFQDKAAPVDAGTPTCVTWQNVDQLVFDNVALDEFVFEIDAASGSAAVVEVPALGQRFARA